DPGKLNKRVFEALIQAGAMDSLGTNRATLTAQLPEAVKAAEQNLRDREAGPTSLDAGTQTGRRARHARALPVGPPDRSVARGVDATRDLPDRRDRAALRTACAPRQW